MYITKFITIMNSKYKNNNLNNDEILLNNKSLKKGDLFIQKKILIKILKEKFIANNVI